MENWEENSSAILMKKYLFSCRFRNSRWGNEEIYEDWSVRVCFISPQSFFTQAEGTCSVVLAAAFGILLIFIEKLCVLRTTLSLSTQSRIIYNCLSRPLWPLSNFNSFLSAAEISTRVFGFFLLSQAHPCAKATPINLGFTCYSLVCFLPSSSTLLTPFPLATRKI